MGTPQTGTGSPEASVRAVVLRLVRRDEIGRWDEMMAAHHYLGFRTLVGESLKYVAEQDGRWLALVGWGTAAFKCGPRDRWIGWTPSQQWRRLRYIANNQRFLILPGAKRPNLASKVLAANLRRLSWDWQAIFGHPVVLAETFVDPDFAGTCYRAASWEELGKTQGYGRNGGRYHFHGRPKSIWVRPLHRKGRRWLAAPFDVPAFQPGGVNLPDLNYVLDSKGELLELLAHLPDPRMRRGIRHRQANILVVAICATLAGMRSFVAIGEWAAALPQEALEQLGCRWHPIQKRYLPPSEPTLRRTLQAVDANLVDRELGHFLESRVQGAALAVDGKTLRGAVDEHGKQVHLLGVLVHKSGVVVGQRQVDGKHNEITEFKPALDPLDLAGKVVTADAMHTQREHARYLVEDKKADYLFIAKGNQATLEKDLRALGDNLFSPSGHPGRKGPRPH